MNRANLRCLGLAVGIAIALAGCQRPTPFERAANQERNAQRFAQDDVDQAYDHCLYRVTGPFAGASIEVMRECQRQAEAIRPERIAYWRNAL